MTVIDYATGEIVDETAVALPVDATAVERAADPAHYVTTCLERAKTWLTQCLDHGDIDQIVELKAQGEAIRVYTLQKQLGKDSELAATEIVRRAERGIGVAIRRGQAAGEIRKQGENLNGASEPYLRERFGNVEVVQPPVGNANTCLPPGPSDVSGMARDALTVGPYALTDNISDDAFEDAVSQAKAEGNLSRANVVRKAKNEPAPPAARPQHLRRMRHLDANRVIEGAVTAFRDAEPSTDLLAAIDLGDLDRNNLGEWVSSLSESLKALRSLKTTLEKELSRGQE